ncbi:MAG: hypothetical protein KVP17_000231 [Porospora cf. gigantea B]|uniref:uncharacterized protein n=1 Tax=Porospora cf. gigantea B TaxID=2853592 RepID=UPI003571AF78|nr:MAG: hypothetical protein KVP17_000231 [Porospora cf. gigantea B]
MPNDSDIPSVALISDDWFLLADYLVFQLRITGPHIAEFKNLGLPQCLTTHTFLLWASAPV